MYLSEGLQKKWEGVLDHPDMAPIKDPYRKAVTAVVLENQAQEMQKTAGMLYETGSPTNFAGTGGFSGSAAAAGPVAGFDPILISLVRRSLPNLIAYDVCGVQPMTGPTGLIFAMRTRYASQSGDEAFYNEANTQFSGANTALIAQVASQLTALTIAANTTEVFQSNANAAVAMTTGSAEALGDGAAGNTFQEMAFSIEKVTVTARTRALKAEYSMELAQDLKAVHGLDAETELANILSTEILAEINREVTIAKTTRRGKGNIMICSSDVASAFAMAGILDYQSALQGQVNLTVDDTGNTFAGTMFGRIKVYIDPYAQASSTNEFAVVGFKGSNAYDAGIFYCPYVPLQMVRAVDTGTFQPKIGFKTRYGLVANPFAEGTSQGLGALNRQANNYYRAFAIKNIM